MGEATREHTWDRWRVFWHAGYLASVVLATAHAWSLTGTSVALVLGGGLVAVTVVFIGVMRRLARPHVASVHALVSMALAFAGTWTDPIYLAVLGCLVAEIFTTLSMRWAVPHVALLTALMAVRMLMFGQSFGATIVVFTMVLGTGLAAFIGSIIEQSQERARLIAELESTRNDLAAAERERGVLAERQRLSHEIHDTLTQDLIGIVRILESAEHELPANAEALQNTETLRGFIRRAEEVARDGVAQSRRLAWSKRPPPLVNATLKTALGSVVERFRADSGIAVELVVTSEPSALPLDVEVTLLRAAQEALANVAKHAQASAVTITLTTLGDCVTLDVHDDGKGFTVNDEKSRNEVGDEGGFGLIALRQRVEGVGGVVEIESAIGEGTTIAVQVPLASAGEST
jgi:signal transduction histidine kinase